MLVRSKLDSFLPNLKAANDSLPKDISTLDIENVGDGDEQYIEMDLGLGVLEEKRDESDSERGDDEGDEGETTTRDVMGKLMNQSGQLTRPGIITETETTTTTGAESGLLCDDRLVRYRTLCHPALRYEMDIVISLMSRILIQLRRYRAVKDVATITKMNVLKEDMYKLMSRRDRLLLDHHEPDRLKHEALYLDELDDLI